MVLICLCAEKDSNFEVIRTALIEEWHIRWIAIALHYNNVCFNAFSYSCFVVFTTVLLRSPSVWSLSYRFINKWQPPSPAPAVVPVLTETPSLLPDFHFRDLVTRGCNTESFHSLLFTSSRPCVSFGFLFRKYALDSFKDLLSQQNGNVLYDCRREKDGWKT